MEFLSTGNSLYVIKEAGVYRIQLADDIDPARANPNIPNLNQQVLAAGHNNEIVARILLTAKYLWREQCDLKPFVASLFENCLILTQQILELDAMTRDLADEIVQKETAFAERPAAPNAVIIPSICGKETKLHNILSKADKAKDTLLTICRLQFLPDKKDRPKLEALETAIEKSLSAEPQLIAAWKGAAKYFTLVRNARNASEHPKDNYRIILSDFACVLMEKSILHLSKYSIQTHPIMTAHS
jgi:hypothetical protein